MAERCRSCKRLLADYERLAGVCEPCGELRCNRPAPPHFPGWGWAVLSLLVVALTVLAVYFLWHAGASHAGN